MPTPKSIAILGSGPAALMAAEVVSSAGHRVSIYEKRKGAGRKLLIAGSSGLNITNSLPHDEFIKPYSGPRELWERVLKTFSPKDWIEFIHGLGINTFEGTSGRYFVENMKASKLLQAWLKRLTDRGVQIHFDHECTDFSRNAGTARITLRFNDDRSAEHDAVLFGLGGGSYEPNEVPLRWPGIFKRNGLQFHEFTPSNSGMQVAWTEPFLKEAEGLPLKNFTLNTPKGSRKGEAVITKYGMEGTPVYSVGVVGPVKLDLKPDMDEKQMLRKCRDMRENLSPIRRVKRQLNLSPAALALIFHFTPKPVLADLEQLVRHIKSFPLEFLGRQPLTESISSDGGLDLAELDESFMLRKHPGVFAAGEMLNWDVPTGGFLIQGCISQGYCAGKGILGYLEGRHP